MLRDYEDTEFGKLIVEVVYNNLEKDNYILLTFQELEDERYIKIENEVDLIEKLSNLENLVNDFVSDVRYQIEVENTRMADFIDRHQDNLKWRV